MDTDLSPKEFLEHYGILGMRWGVRRSERELARARGERLKKGKPVTPTKTAEKRARKYSEDAEKAKESLKKAKKSGTQSLSNKELKDLNERLNLEQNYKRLTEKKGPGKIKKGKKFVDDAVDMGKTVNEVYKLANSPVAKDVRKVLQGQNVSKPTPSSGAQQLEFDLGKKKRKK